MGKSYDSGTILSGNTSILEVASQPWRQAHNRFVYRALATFSRSRQSARRGARHHRWMSAVSNTSTTAPNALARRTPPSSPHKLSPPPVSGRRSLRRGAPGVKGRFGPSFSRSPQLVARQTPHRNRRRNEISCRLLYERFKINRVGNRARSRRLYRRGFASECRTWCPVINRRSSPRADGLASDDDVRETGRRLRVSAGLALRSDLG